MTKEQAIRQFQVNLMVLNYRPNTIKSYIILVKAFLRWLEKDDVTEIKESHVIDFILHLRTSSHKPSCANAYRAALICFCWNTMHIEINPLHIPLIRKDAPEPKCFSEDELKKLLKTDDPRLRLVILLGCDCGLRVSEIACLRVRDIKSESCLIHIENAKGGKSRNVKLSSAIVRELERYKREENLGGHMDAGWLFPSRKGGHLTTRSLEIMVKERIQEAGLDDKGCSFHSLRHCYATGMIEKGCGLFLLQKMMGHSTMATTAQYFHFTTLDIRNAISLSDGWTI